MHVVALEEHYTAPRVGRALHRS